MPHLDYGVTLHVRPLDFIFVSSSVLLKGGSSFNTELSFWVTHLLASVGCLLSCGIPLPGHLSPSMQRPAILHLSSAVSCLPSQSHCLSFPLFIPYLLCLSSDFPLLFPLHRKSCTSFKLVGCPMFPLLVRPSPSLAILGVCSWQLWLPFFITGLIWVLLSMTSTSRYLISLWCSDTHRQKVRQIAWDTAIPSVLFLFHLRKGTTQEDCSNYMCSNFILPAAVSENALLQGYPTSTKKGSRIW